MKLYYKHLKLVLNSTENGHRQHLKMQTFEVILVEHLQIFEVILQTFEIVLAEPLQIFEVILQTFGVGTEPL